MHCITALVPAFLNFFETKINKIFFVITYFINRKFSYDFDMSQISHFLTQFKQNVLK